MGIDLTNLAPAAGAGAGCSCGPSSPVCKPADVSFELLVERASDGSAAADSEPSPGPAARQPASLDPAQHAASNPAAQQAKAASAAISRQQAPAEAKALRKSDSGTPSSLDEDGATDEAQQSGSPEDPWAALLAATAAAENSAEPPRLPFREAAVEGPGRTIGSDSPAARPPQPGDPIAVPALDANAEAAEADPKVGGWAEGAGQSIRAGEVQPVPVPTAAGSDHVGPSDEPQPAERAARTSPSRADLTQGALRYARGGESMDQRRPDGQLEAASQQAIRAMLGRALTTGSAQGADLGERPDADAALAATPAADSRSTAGTGAAFSAPEFADLFQVPADEAVRRYADLLAAQAPTQCDVKLVDSPAPRGATDAAAGDVARAFSLASMAANPTALGAPASAEPSPARTPVEAPLTPQIVKAVSLLWRDGIGEARLRLEPEHLGSVTVSLRVERGVVTARMTADVPGVRDWIRTHEAELRDGLASQGLELDQIVVSADPDDRNRQPAPDSNSQPRAPRASRGGPKFELNA